jgi:hypothetical protein
MIKNRTPYLGKIYLKFEKYPEYSGRTFLNKIHLNLGFTKLVSRIRPNTVKSGFEVDPKKIELINKLSGGKIEDIQLDGRIGEEFTLHNSFISHNGDYLGDVRDAWWYVQNRMIISNKYPRGVAIKVKKEFFKMGLSDHPIQSYSEKFIEGIYGYSHRGGALFKIGDRIFDSEYYPQMEDYDLKEWKKYRKELEKKVNKEIDEYGVISPFSIRDWIPFNRRGKKIITNWDEAEEAAKKLSQYLS